MPSVRLVGSSNWTSALTTWSAADSIMDAMETITAPATADAWRLGHILDGVAQTAPDSTALIVGSGRRRITYANLAELVAEQSAALQRCGLLPGDVLTLQSTNSIEFVVGLLAAARADIVVAPLDPALPSVEQRRRVDMVGARATLIGAHEPHRGASAGDCPDWFLETTQDSASGARPAMRLVVDHPARVVDFPPRGLTSRDAMIMFTSGTTGTPKMVPWTHDNIAASIAGIAGAYQLSPSDATVAVMPLFHGHGLIAALLATLASGGSILLPARGKFSAHTFWDDVATVDATWYTAVPTIHQILLNRAATDLPVSYKGRLRLIRSCSAPLPPSTVERIEDTFKAPVLAAYGMTEATHQASTVRPSDDQPTRMQTVGEPTGPSVRIVDGNGQDCPAGAIGEIWLHGPTVVRGYLDNADDTAATFVDSWLRTGDLGAVDSHGTLSVKGRIKELINRGGEKISPEHVEDVLTSYPGVAAAAVFGLPDDLYGEKVAAVVVMRNGRRLDPKDLSSYCRARLAAFEIPERINFAKELPVTPKGSVDRSKLAVLFGDEADSGKS
jgi:acyl-CoA synthetase (AMP-forming)/AMP-acid ligase II